MSPKLAAQDRPVLVTAAIIREGDQILIAQRKSDTPIEPGKWEFPGGKVEHGEHPQDCLVREIKEELNLDIRVEKLFDMASHVYTANEGAVHIVLLAYFCTRLGGELKPLDVKDVRWIPVRDLTRYEYAAADVPLVERLYGELT